MDLTEQTPSQLAELRLKLSDDYSKAGELKVRMMRARAEYYQDHRDDVKSDAALERLWETTNSGLELMELNMKMKTIERKMSAIKTLLDVRNMEARNQY